MWIGFKWLGVQSTDVLKGTQQYTFWSRKVERICEQSERLPAFQEGICSINFVRPQIVRSISEEEKYVNDT
jgi:hypothetical protein